MQASHGSTVQSLADQWAGTTCFLDGKSAQIRGRLRDFAIVAQDFGPLQVEFSWPAVDRIMQRDRRFSSGAEESRPVTLITLRRGTDCWLSIVNSPEVIDLFGTGILPTAYTAQCPADKVLASIRKLNPAAIVVLESEGGAE
jgi:hypothetical protein